MKRCNACGEEFTDKFSFCPVDGKPLEIRLNAQSAPAEFQLTFISDEGLPHRLANQLCFVIDQVRQAWPSVKDDPIAFAATRVDAAKRFLKM